MVDCRFSLDDTERGRRDYLKAHIPGAVYAHLDDDLSGKRIPGKTGRHPLPEVQSFAATLSSWGIDADTQVVVYDDATGTMAARLWWMLQWVGHANVAVLDGGWMSWIHSGLPARSGPESRAPKHFEPLETPGRIRHNRAGAGSQETIRATFCSTPAAGRVSGEKSSRSIPWRAIFQGRFPPPAKRT